VYTGVHSFLCREPRPAAQPSHGAFRRYARTAHSSGLAVLPTAPDDAKRPLVRGWARQLQQPRLSTIDGWAERFADANLAYQPAPSGLAVLDLDDPAQEGRACKLLGIDDTPLIITTGRGLHLPLRSTPIPGIDLRRFGIAGEIKGARSIVVAPGSLHPKTGRPYAFVVGSWEEFASVPELDRSRLEHLIERPLETIEALAVPKRRNREGTRNNATFAYLRALAGAGLFYCCDDVRAAALEYNAEHNDPPEPERNVLATADSVWRLVDRGACRAPKPVSFVTLTGREHSALRSLDTSEYSYADAQTLLLALKAAHGARAQRGETFAIAAKAMAETQVVPGWTDRKRYMRATRGLLSIGLIEQVTGVELQKWMGTDGKRRVRGQRAAQYRFALACGEP
jgi:hypothetical protein